MLRLFKPSSGLDKHRKFRHPGRLLFSSSRPRPGIQQAVMVTRSVVIGKIIKKERRPTAWPWLASLDSRLRGHDKKGYGRHQKFCHPGLRRIPKHRRHRLQKEVSGGGVYLGPTPLQRLNKSIYGKAV